MTREGGRESGLLFCMRQGLACEASLGVRSSALRTQQRLAYAAALGVHSCASPKPLGESGVALV
ncbi:hypothetical protein [Paenibacillus ferrarius]|uniref:hypothetical protein n=1 Tax=Paenibacillus ferrarius TaxID=1469647 RepID=UPI00117F2EFF|nr:hypothetical protein [Paenibacillus ferrarius]